MRARPQLTDLFFLLAKATNKCLMLAEYSDYHDNLQDLVMTCCTNSNYKDDETLYKS